MSRRAMLIGCAVAALTALTAASCGSSDTGRSQIDDTQIDETQIDEAAVEGSVVVFAAASLTNVFGEMATAFEDEFPDASVELNLAGSSTLREQILGGAPADIFASADEPNMNVVVAAGEIRSSPVVFAHNILQIAVPTSNPGAVAGLADLAEADLLVGLCAEGVPCGDFARAVLQAADIEVSIDTNEGDVRALLTKIEADELDAGIVYATDVESSTRVVGVDIPADVNVVVPYPIAILATTRNAAGANAFVDFVLSPVGQGILAAGGFDPA